MGALCFCAWAFYQIGGAAKQIKATDAENRADIRSMIKSAKTGVDDVFAETRDVTRQLLQPCKPGKPETCGLIPAVRSVAVNAGSATVAMQTQIQQTEPVIQAAAAALSNTSDHANKLIDTATEATAQARDDLKTLNSPISDSGALLEAYTAAGNHLNEILKQKAITETLNNMASMTGSGAGILADGKKVTDKATADYLSPKPWWMKVGRFASDTYDYGALFARHTP